MIETYLADYDYNLPRRDAEDDPELGPRRRMLAAIGCHVALDSGYYDAQALADALLQLARSQNSSDPTATSAAREQLAELLGRDDLGYQKAAYRIVAVAPIADAAADMCWLADLMRIRADMARPLRAMGLNPALPDR